MTRWYLAVVAVFTFAVVLLADQISKAFWVTDSLNSGISFGVASGWGSLPLATGGLLLLLSWWFFSLAWRSGWAWWAWAAIGGLIGGGFSNILDRLLLEAVRDPLVIPFTSIQNNVADYAIFGSIILIILAMVTHKPALPTAKQEIPS